MCAAAYLLDLNKKTLRKIMIQIDPTVKGLIFDCDGTLAYTMEVHWKAWIDAFDHFGCSCSIDYLDNLCGTAGQDIVRAYNKSFNKDLDPKSVADYKQGLVVEKLKATREVVSVCNVVRKYQGVLPMSVASGGTRRNVHIILEAIGLLEAFEAILTADEPILAKPSPDIFLESARLMGCAPETCLVFEDGTQGFAAAKAAGIPCIDVRPYYAG
jgi:beta-phosphoglucomutase-like phosphatase (HAD superfamily)